MLKTGAATQQTVDQEETALRSAEAKVAAASAALATAQAAMGRPAEIEGQKSLVDSLEAALKQAQWRLDQRSVAAPDAALVADVIAFPGETLASGAPVVSLLPAQNIFVRFFIPEPELARVHVGDKVSFACDDCPRRFGRRRLLHLAAGRVHAAVHLFRADEQQVRLPRRGSAAAGRRRRFSIRASQ